MKKPSLIALAGILALSVVLSGCHKEDPDRTSFDRIMVYYGMAYNNLDPVMSDDVTRGLLNGDIPGKNDPQALFVFYHGTAAGGDYSTPNPAYLYRVYRKDEKTVKDTLKVYDKTVISASAETVKDVLNTLKANYSSSSYGLVISSHATGWLPADTPKSGKSKAGIGQNAIGAQFRGGTSVKSEIDLRDFAKAIPFKLEYIAFDCCLMGCIEVAAELKDVCSHILFSPTEILTDGFDYDNLTRRLLLSRTIDLEGAAQDYFNKYAKASQAFATATLVDCSRLDAVSSAMASIISAHRTELTALEQGIRNAQPYFYSSSPVVKCFYDMRDIAVRIGATADELGRLDAALDEFIEFEVHTDKFFDLRLNDKDGSSLVCGVSMYLPSSRWPEMNSYYTGLSWNNSVKVIDK